MVNLLTDWQNGGVVRVSVPELRTKNISKDDLYLMISSGFLPAYWNATRAFMILSGMSCFAGIIAGIMSFAHFSSFERFNRSFAAGIMFFVSSEFCSPWIDTHWRTHTYTYLNHNWHVPSYLPLSFLCSAGHGHLYWSDSQLPGEALRWLALLLVLHTGLGGHAHDLLCRWERTKVGGQCLSRHRPHYY